MAGNQWTLGGAENVTMDQFWDWVKVGDVDSYENKSRDWSAAPNYRKICGLIWTREYGVNIVLSFSATSYIFTIIL